MQSRETIIPAVTETKEIVTYEEVEISPARPVLTLELDPDDAMFLAVVLGKRNGPMNGEYDSTASLIYYACREFVDEHHPQPYSRHPFNLKEVALRQQMQTCGLV